MADEFDQFHDRYVRGEVAQLREDIPELKRVESLPDLQDLKLVGHQNLGRILAFDYEGKSSTLFPHVRAALINNGMASRNQMCHSSGSNEGTSAEVYSVTMGFYGSKLQITLTLQRGEPVQTTYDIGGNKFIVREGNIADYVGGAIAVPSHPGLDMSNVVSHAIIDKAEKQGHGRRMFERIHRENAGARYEKGSAFAAKANELDGVDYVVYAICEGQNLGNDKDNYALLNSTTDNVLALAEEKGVSGIALPIFNSGIAGVKPRVSVRAIRDATINHLEADGLQEVVLYAWGKDNYRTAKSVADAKLSK